MQIKTADLYVSAGIVASGGGRLIGADSDFAGRVEFTIETEKPLAEWEILFASGELIVPAVRYRDCLNTFREIIYGQRKRNGKNEMEHPLWTTPTK